MQCCKLLRNSNLWSQTFVIKKIQDITIINISEKRYFTVKTLVVKKRYLIGRIPFVKKNHLIVAIWVDEKEYFSLQKWSLSHVRYDNDFDDYHISVVAKTNVS